MNGEVISSVVFHKNMWNVENFVNYDSTAFMPMLVQVFHRTVAYIVTGLIIFFFFKVRRETARPLIRGSQMMLGMLLIQFTLGVLTIINCVGSVPVSLGVLHQGGAIILLGIALFVNYQFYTFKKV